MDSYYLRGEVSNSDLSALEKYFKPDSFDIDPTEAYRFGNLVDALLTEPEKVDYFKKTVSDYPDMPFTDEQWSTAIEMKKAFKKDSFCLQILTASETQKKFFETVTLTWGKYRFQLRMRCKYDLWSGMLGWGGDIKSTTATSQEQFIEACKHFQYDRQRAVYMTLSGAPKDIIIGISKEKPHKIFKLPITRNDEFFKAGMEKFTDLAFKWHCLYENTGLHFNTIQNA